MAEQPGFSYFECEECNFSSVQRSDFKGSTFCPLCAGDSGHDVGLIERVCRDTDKPEGFDARKGTRSEQDAALASPISSTHQPGGDQ